jgi:hypothetical protein
MKLGLLPREHDARDISLGAVYKPTRSLPDTFGARGLGWGVLGNEDYGNCYWASAAHEVMAQAHLAGRSPKFDDKGVLNSYALYLRLYGAEALDESNDTGTEPRAGAKFRQKHGVEDAHASGHRIGAYVFEEAPDYEKLLAAIYDFGAVTLCFDLPQSAEETFDQGVWDYHPGSAILGGHAVAGVARADSGRIVAVSWGAEVEITPAFIEHYLQCAVVYVSGSVLDGSGHAPDGLDKPALLEALRSVNS